MLPGGVVCFKTGLEREARKRQISLSALLDLAARDYLERTGADPTEEDEQARLRRTASQCFGAFDGGDPGRTANTSSILRQRLRQRQQHESQRR